ncbi:MAG: NAD(P)-binding domain-containing protein [Rubrivivax sp.]|nr:NAD(P)-binding domain-containing protein [Rubrivivax sp.]
MTDHYTLLVYVALFALSIGLYLALARRRSRRARAEHERAVAEGLDEPASLHPVVNPTRCIGSGGCVHACPEGALGIVGGRAVLVNGAACIGHGACHAACPVDAIRLVFGTARRGVDIPAVSPQFESNVPGLFIAGELGGMGLIRKAAEQGRQAVDAIRRRRGSGDELDLVIVGAGPAGLSAGLAAMEQGLRFRLIEQEASLGGSVFHYPRQKVAMTAPVRLALVGTLRVGEVRKERLLELWGDIVRRTGLRIAFGERMEGIAPAGEGFVVRTNLGTLATRSVLLAIGRRGSPRRLDVPGEDSPQVAYTLVDPAEYRGQRVLVVGGGDSALEAALALAAEPGTTVTLSHRSGSFSRAKEKNRRALDEARAAGRVEVVLESAVLRIEAGSVQLATPAGERALPNDRVLVCAGGVLPTALLQSVGIRFETKHGSE